IDRLMAATSEAVGLLFDTGHVTFGGGDPLAVLDKHIGRVCHVHCKDVRPEVIRLARNRNWSFLQSVINGAFTVPGDGAVDFPAVIERLKRHGYRGWFVVEAEQDPVIAPSYAYAEKGYRTLRALLQPATSREVLARMLNNLKAIYLQTERWQRLLAVQQRLVVLLPGQLDEVRDRGFAYARLDYLRPALEDLEMYLDECPEAVDATIVEAQLSELRQRMRRGDED
ncbi:tetratricopeptide repeat protein, partial [Burkholderia gladioli]|nr:tetratricopeptide repeat protein [Burkholderia gladioli]